MTNILRRVVISLAVASLLGMTGCGIQPTGIIDAGEAPTGIAAGPRIYFIDGESVKPIQRNTGKLGTLQAALDALAAGPTGDEHVLGLTTAIPAATLRLDKSNENYAVTVIGNSSPIPNAGMGQIVCTVASWNTTAHGSDITDWVTITEGRNSYGPFSCPNFLS